MTTRELIEAYVMATRILDSAETILETLTRDYPTQTTLIAAVQAVITETSAIQTQTINTLRQT